jgi:hypothetical protein
VLQVPAPSPDEALGTGPATREASTQSEAVRWVWEGATDRAPGLFVISMQGLAAVAASRGISLSGEMISRLPESFAASLRGANAHSMVIARKGSEGLEHLQAIATTRIDVSIQQGRIFVHGLIPWTPNFVLVEGSESRPYDLLRIV